MALPKTYLKSALFISFIRFPLLLAGALLTCLIFWAIGKPFTLPPTPDLSTLYFIVVNVVCFFILARVLRRENKTIGELIGFDKKRFGKDVAWGFLWLFVLYLPFVAGIMGSMFLMFGTDMLNSFEMVFAPAASSIVELPYMFTLITAILIAIVFPFVNAPIEELFYRGYAQPRIIAATGKVWLGILIPTIGFSLQHIMLASTWYAMIVYAVAFFIWGLVAAIIFQKQKRMMPIIVAHFLTNFFLGLAPLIIVLFS